MEIEAEIQRAADALRGAKALIVAAGAGMGVDSGLPDFRGDDGFWNAYPPYRNLGVSFIDMANPAWFRKEPAFAWGFYGHRRNLYRQTVPHEGFATLLRWGSAMPGGTVVFTSNVDGQFQRAGFDPQLVVECHGAIDFNQCMEQCGVGIYPGGQESIEVDTETMRAADPLPACPDCGALARPNILMFGDFGWDEQRTGEQHDRLREWIKQIEPPLVVVECGAGTAIPSVRSFASHTADAGGTLIRINPREPQIKGQQVGLPLGALDAIQRIDALLVS